MIISFEYESNIVYFIYNLNSKVLTIMINL